MNITSKVVTDEPWKGVRWFINGEAVVPPIKIERGKASLLKMVAPELKGAVVKLNAIDADRLKFVAVPRFDEDVVLDENGAAQWTLTQSQSISAVLRLTVETNQSPVKLQDSFFVMSKNLADEVGFLLEGAIIPPEGAEFIGGESKSLKLSYFNAEVLESMPLAIEVEIESGLTPGDIESVPATGELVSKHDWLVSAAEKNGTFKIKLHSFDWVTPLYTPLLRLKTVETVFIFMDKGLNPLPVPPEEFLLPASVPIQNIVAILKNTDGVPFRDVPGVFHHPGMQDFPFKTNADGRVNLWVQNQENSSGHTFKVSAVVELETESRVADLLVRIV
ncbi:hypothetical protein [Pseudomonas sp. MYb118]|uniref:hypothetical protein n=1 Tax=Pseudomonas sp. MYb118 TaxID=1848720 RepID=UPI0034CE5A78